MRFPPHERAFYARAAPGCDGVSGVILSSATRRTPNASAHGRTYRLPPTQVWAPGRLLLDAWARGAGSRYGHRRAAVAAGGRAAAASRPAPAEEMGELDSRTRTSAAHGAPAVGGSDGGTSNGTSNGGSTYGNGGLPSSSQEGKRPRSGLSSSSSSSPRAAQGRRSQIVWTVALAGVAWLIRRWQQSTWVVLSMYAWRRSIFSLTPPSE